MKPPKRLSLCACVINSECCVTELYFVPQFELNLPNPKKRLNKSVEFLVHFIQADDWSGHFSQLQRGIWARVGNVGAITAL